MHAVRAELAAFGRAEPRAGAERPQVRPALPVHPVPEAIKEPTQPPRLRIDGLVRQSIVVGVADVQALPHAELAEPFVCEEGWMVPALRWSGVRLSTLLDLAEPLPNARFVRVGAGAYAAHLPIDAARTALLADTLDSAPLAIEHGGPWRVVVPGGACYTSVKWVDHLLLGAEPAEDARSRQI